MKAHGELSMVRGGASRRKSLSHIFDRTASLGTLNRRALHCEYPMYVVSLDVLLSEQRMRPHEEMMADGKLQVWDEGMKGHTIFVSHQWTAFTHPDPSGTQLRCLQHSLRRLASKEVPKVEDDVSTLAQNEGKLCTVLAEEWAEVLPHCFFWMDYWSIAQRSDQLALQQAGIRSIPGYFSRVSLMLVLAPLIVHHDLPDVVCNYSSWRKRGWCRLEFVAAALGGSNARIMLIQGARATPEFLYSLGVNQLLVGAGEFSCCANNHAIGSRKCDKLMLRLVLEQMLDEKISALFQLGGKGEMIEARFLVAAREWYLHGLDSAEASLHASEHSSHVAIRTTPSPNEANGPGLIASSMCAPCTPSTPSATASQPVISSSTTHPAVPARQQAAWVGLRGGLRLKVLSLPRQLEAEECQLAAADLRKRLRAEHWLEPSELQLSSLRPTTGRTTTRTTRRQHTISGRSHTAECHFRRATGWSVLHYAAMADDLAAAAHELRNGSNVNLATKGNALNLGWGYHLTPLHLAMSYASFSMVELLLDARADPHATEGSVAYTAVMRAAIFGQHENIRQWMLRFPSYPLDKRNAFGNSALHMACFLGTRKRETVRFLLASKCDPRSPNYACVTPLMAAIYNEDDSEALVEMMHELRSSASKSPSVSSAYLQLATDINARAWPRGLYMKSIFSLARLATYAGSDNKLLRWLASYPGHTALHVAAAKGNVAGAKLLIAAHADTTIVNRQGLTPLEIASASFGGEVPPPLATVLSFQPLASSAEALSFTIPQALRPGSQLEGSQLEGTRRSLHTSVVEEVHGSNDKPDGLWCDNKQSVKWSGDHPVIQSVNQSVNQGMQQLLTLQGVQELLTPLKEQLAQLTLRLDEVERARASDQDIIAALSRELAILSATLSPQKSEHTEQREERQGAQPIVEEDDSRQLLILHNLNSAVERLKPATASSTLHAEATSADGVASHPLPAHVASLPPLLSQLSRRFFSPASESSENPTAVPNCMGIPQLEETQPFSHDPGQGSGASQQELKVKRRSDESQGLHILQA